MAKMLKPFLAGVVTAVLLAAVWYYATGGQWFQSRQPSSYPPGTVSIKALPPILTSRGIDVPFEGKKEITLPISGKLAQGLVIVNFQATGENANKSAIKIYWEDGAVEIIPPGTTNRVFQPDRRAKQIVIAAYSMYERRILHDLARKGTLNWEIRYEPVES